METDPSATLPPKAAAAVPQQRSGTAAAFHLRPLVQKRQTLLVFTVAWVIPWNLIAANISGDIGGYTIYTDRFGRPTVFPKSPPEKPPSPAQVLQRRRFADSHSLWQQLPSAEKRALEDACRKLSVNMTGKNAFMSACLLNRDDNLQTLSRQSGIPLPPATYIP